MKVVWIVLAVLTVVAVAVGAWFYLREEYAFQDVGDGDVVGLTYEGPAGDGWVYGSVDEAPDDLPRWVRGWERDTSGESATTDTTVTIALADGRAIRVDMGGKRGYATWISAAGAAGECVAVYFNDGFVRYVEGLGDGLTASQPAPTPSPFSSGSLPLPTATPSE